MRFFYTLLILLALSYAGWQFFSISTDRFLFSAVPNDAFSLVWMQNQQQVLSGLDSLPWFSNLKQTNYGQRLIEELKLIDSILFQNKQHTSLISAHLTNANQFDFLFLAPANQLPQNLSKFIQECRVKNYPINEHYLKGSTVFEIQLPNHPNPFIVANDGYLVAASFAPNLVDNAIAEYSHPLSNGFAFKLPNLQYKLPKFSLFLHLGQFSLLKKMLFDEQDMSLLTPLSEDAQWISLHSVAQTPSGWSFEGSLKFKDSESAVKKIASQTAATTGGAGHLAPNNSGFIWWASSNNTNLLFDGIFKNPQWIGNDWVLGCTALTNKDIARNTYAIIRINDAQAAHQALLQLAKSANSNTPSNSGNTQSKLLLLDKYPQLPINAQPLISQLYGQQIGLWFSQAQAAILPNCIVITTHANHLLVVTSSILQGQTLGIQTNFRNFFTQLNVNTTQFFYVQTPQLYPWLMGIVSPNLKTELSQIASSYQSLSPLGLGISPHFLGWSEVQMHIFYTPQNKLPIYNDNGSFLLQNKANTTTSPLATAWVQTLNAPLMAAPQGIYNPQNQSQYIIAHDQQHNIYLFDIAGKTQWQKKLSQGVIGNFTQPDYYNNKQRQISFVTTDSLYLWGLMDAKGHDGFPKRLPEPANAGLVVVNFEDDNNNNGDALFIPCGKSVYGFTRLGVPLSGWRPNQTGQSYWPVAPMRINGQTAIAVLTTDGYTTLYNKLGKELWKTKTGTSIGKLQVDYIGEQAFLTFVTPQNELISVDGAGKLKRKPLSGNKISSFLTSNLVGTPTDERVFLQGNSILTNDYGGTLIFKTTLKNNTAEIFSMRRNNSTNIIGVWWPGNNAINLLTEKGKWMLPSDLPASTPACLIPLNNFNKYLLVCGTTPNNLQAYSFN
ncbi:MAG: hypothetical protein IPI59_11760 [Sphingobacteriales bacterium]|nr:hypothetical protein [Sphingobacteriales bacterium]MBP9141172.1 hypothetical protein [Chitinophagales bacterium]MDA0198152.1 hypothetical protein [Bacteroidota bacterium]MBK7528205.1 hypothetical protein [Sphingobacteriales bacterium]MBL0246067.1 hypothetical protein [Sphingobacteriales bacterium]